jgi:hypothetical protein
MQKKRENVYLMQFPPMKRTIFVGGKSFYLPFPCLFFQYYFRSLSVAFSPEPITSLKQTVYFPWLPNISSDNWVVCLGRNESNIKSAINIFWNSFFDSDFDGDDGGDDDIDWEGSEVREDVVGSYKNWARLSLNTVCKRVFKINRTMNVKQFLNYDIRTVGGYKMIGE